MREPGSRYIDFLLPGLLGMNIMGSSIWGLAFGIVTHNHMWLFTALLGLGLSFLQIRHQRREATAGGSAGSGADKS